MLALFSVARGAVTLILSTVEVATIMYDCMRLHCMHFDFDITAAVLNSEEIEFRVLQLHTAYAYICNIERGAAQ